MSENGKVNKLGIKRTFQVVDWVRANRDNINGKMTRDQVAEACGKAIDFPVTWESVQRCVNAAGVTINPMYKSPRSAGGTKKSENLRRLDALEKEIGRLNALLTDLYSKLGETPPTYVG